jgi:hypothetical protein
MSHSVFVLITASENASGLDFLHENEKEVKTLERTLVDPDSVAFESQKLTSIRSDKAIQFHPDGTRFEMYLLVKSVFGHQIPFPKAKARFRTIFCGQAGWTER